MTAQIKIFGVREALFAFRELPRRVGFKWLRIALSAAGGIIRDQAAQNARRETGLLAKSLGVKVKIPDASFNAAHHGKPAYVVIGPKRHSGRLLKINARGNLRGFGAAQKALAAERKRLNKEGLLSPLRREHAAIVAVAKQFPHAIYRNPSRYAHLIEKGTKHSRAFPFLAPAVSQTKGAVLGKIGAKLGEGIDTEARALVPVGA